jgi:lipoprotein-anchoring transpeptidase ErfK/SrfK
VRVRSRVVVVLGVVAVAACGVGAAVAVAGQDDGEQRPPVTLAADPVEPVEVSADDDAGAVAPVEGFTAGKATVGLLEAYATPNPPPGTEPVATATNPTHEGFPLVVSVIERSPDGAWLHVRLPQRPNGTHGWVRAAELTTWVVPNRIEVDLDEHRLRVFRADTTEVLFDTDVATGRPQTPTPVGDFFIDIVNPLGHHPVYGWGQLSVSGFSDVLERFAGGIGQIALHGWNDESVMGTAASNGCIRMRNDDIAAVAALAPLGTPVRIVP